MRLLEKTKLQLNCPYDRVVLVHFCYRKEFGSDINFIDRVSMQNSWFHTICICDHYSLHMAKCTCAYISSPTASIIGTTANGLAGYSTRQGKTIQSHNKTKNNESNYGTVKIAFNNNLQDRINNSTVLLP